MLERVIPGVQVSVVKDVVVPQLAPAGVLGVVGLVEDARSGIGRAESWRRLVKLYGPGTAHSMPEARAALENGVTEVVVVPLSPASSSAKIARATVSAGTVESLVLVARAPGCWANNTTVSISHRKRGDKVVGFDLEVLMPGQQSGEGELFQNLQLLPGFARSLNDTLLNRGSVVRLEASESLRFEAAEFKSALSVNAGESVNLLISHAGAPALRVKAVKALSIYLKKTDAGLHELSISTTGPDGKALKLSRTQFDLRTPEALKSAGLTGTAFELGTPDAAALFDTLSLLEELEVDAALWPDPKRFTVSGGQDATAEEYRSALQSLVDEPDVDLVQAALQFSGDKNADLRKARTVYSALISHAEVMAADSKGRIAFGQVPPGLDVNASVELADSLVSDRFVLMSPCGVAGAVAGRIGSLPYFQSPTFKTLAGVDELTQAHGQEAQKALILGKLLAVAQERGRGVVVVKGITTDGDQISVRRVADRAVRGVKLIGELFIGRLNNADGRSALKQKLNEFLYQMQKDGALVPSTDGKSPAYEVDVYSSQDDFSKGIVRLDLAVRPVRAIDFIYATLHVQV